MDSHTASSLPPKPLESFIRQSWPFDSSCPSHIFSSTNPPMLHPNRINSIITFKGSFNPPHRNHLQLLAHAYHRAPPSWNLVAAFIRCTSDELLRTKAARGNWRDDEPMFTHAQRSALWNETELGEGWFWAFPNDEDEDWLTWRASLVRFARQEKYPIQFIGLIGPDTPVQRREPIERLYPARAVICGELARLTTEEPSADVEDAEKWPLLVSKEEREKWIEQFVGAGDEEVARRRLQIMYPGVQAHDFPGITAKELLRQSLTDTGSIRNRPWETPNKQSCELFFVPVQSMADEKVAYRRIDGYGISSTEIRERIREGEDDEGQEEFLKDCVLSWELLKDFLY